MSRRRGIPRPATRDGQLVRILLLARRLWFAEKHDDADADAEPLRAVLHDALLERYGRAYEEILNAVSQRRGNKSDDDWYNDAWYVTFWPRMLLFAEQGFPGWSERAYMRESPIRFALASGPGAPTGMNRSVLLFWR